MKAFHLEILSPERVFYKGECYSVVLPIGDGMMGVMAGHTPFSAAIFDGEVAFTIPSGERVICAVTRGLVDMENDCLRLLCESALYPDEIDEQATLRAAEEARLELEKKQSGHDFAVWQMTFQRAMNNLRIKNKSSDI